ncbi:MAG: 16S rRNA (cytosine(1402)-N(4))-methyltransferase RsmH [Pseudomonadota bacterium]
MGGGHQTVLRDEAVTALLTERDGFYVDGTFGRGGHSAELLRRLGPGGRLLALDLDPEACAAGAGLAELDPRLELVQGSFAELPQLLDARGMRGRVTGILLDLGVSSPQLDTAERGFSFVRDGPLDMRMDPGRGESAAAWLARAGEAEIAAVLKDYGEEPHARRIARAIVRARARAPLERTAQLAEVIAAAHPAWQPGRHPATLSFQAIRIRVNGELDALRVLLGAVIDLLAVGGRLVAISFHSLEDRLIKRFIRDAGRPAVPRGLPIEEARRRRRGPARGGARRPGAAEVAANPRARSAVLRVAEKVA